MNQTAPDGDLKNAIDIALAELAGARFQAVSRPGLPGSDRAVLVASVTADTPAFRHGLRPADLIVGVNGRRIGSVAELARALRSLGSTSLNVLRGDSLLALRVR